MSCYSNGCYVNGCADESLPNPWADPAMWWMLGGIVLTAILASVVSIPSRLMKFDASADSIIKHEFFIPLPEWTIPILWLGIYITYFLGTYLTWRKIGADCDKSDSDKDKDRGLLSLVYVIILVLMVMWSFSYLGAQQPHFAILVTLGMIGAVVWQLVLMSRYGVTGAWYLVIPLAVYLFFIALPLTVSSVWGSGNSHAMGMNKSMLRKVGSGGGSLFSDLKGLAV